MRPTRLELTGFGSFKEATTIDLEGAEFFALVGPTGSGKSTIIDAICFALYGSVPRLDNRSLVAPVISQGKLEAKVRLDFSLDGSSYTAVRVVRKQASGKGASTKEALLERDGDAVASGPDELTAAVTELLGLGFEHFTRCVVLPQGEFARFLHDKPSDRQGLVEKLLNLGIYGTMGQAARQLAGEKKIEMDLCEAQLADFGRWATPEALEELQARSAKLRTLRETVSTKLPLLDKLGTTEREAEKRAEDAQSWIVKLEKLEIPSDIEDLADLVAAAAKNVTAAEAELAEAAKGTRDAEAALSARGDRRPLARAQQAHEGRDRVLVQLEPAEARLERSAEQLGVKQAALAEAEAAYAAAQEAERQAQIEHQAQHLATQLKKGEPCPVCLQPVSKMPKHTAAPALKDAAALVTTTRKKRDEARTAAEKVGREIAGLEGNVAALRGQLEGFELDVGEHSDVQKLERALEAIDAAEVALDAARKEEGRARDRVDVARKSLAQIEEQGRKARDLFEDARIGVAALEPPAVARESLSEDWKALVKWASKRASELEKEERRATKEADAARSERLGIIDALLASCSECELDVRDESQVLEAVISAHTSAQGEVEKVKEAIAKSEKLRTRIASLDIEQAVATELAQHLSAKPGKFPSWIVNAALRRLVEGANEILGDLSQGQYALTTDDNGNFLVIDRNNANEQRSARTLSGGETFLASLSLALALADQLLDLAAEGAARLEAIFLDEGFGTLDPETLDTVAATVENLSASGRMVGIVTHVRELAERVPLRFRVRKDTGTSTIEREEVA